MDPRYGAENVEVIARWERLGADELPTVGQAVEDFFGTRWSVLEVTAEDAQLGRRTPLRGAETRRMTLRELRTWYLVRKQ
jgi:hypothetical protein